MRIKTRLSAANERLNQYQDDTTYRNFAALDEIIIRLCQRFRLHPEELLRYHDQHGTTPDNLIQQCADGMGVPVEVLENMD